MANARNGSFVWYEHLTADVGQAVTFYSEVLGWKTEPFGDEYLMWVGSQGPLGGLTKLGGGAAGAGGSPRWIGSVHVDDLDATVAAVRQLGGKVTKEPQPIPTVGRFAIIADPQGRALELFQPDRPMTLRDPAKDGEFCWHELLTTDGAAAFRFYAALFGWNELEDMDMGPMGTYRIYGIGEQRLGGMMTIPPGAPMPPMWLFYASTSDLEAAVGRATRKGGKVLTKPMEVPGGGRIAHLADPQGAVFALHQAPRT